MSFTFFIKPLGLWIPPIIFFSSSVAFNFPQTLMTSVGLQCHFSASSFTQSIFFSLVACFSATLSFCPKEMLDWRNVLR